MDLRCTKKQYSQLILKDLNIWIDLNLKIGDWVGATLRNYFRSMNGGERNLESELLKNFINVLDEGCLH